MNFRIYAVAVEKYMIILAIVIVIPEWGSNRNHNQLHLSYNHSIPGT